ncbi:MAG: extracellular solute-binding protein [Rhodobacteraceae bacterium]|jgi:putative spermidine/putrescine transport system substrate-binding protein|nr:extracellular solute-binding protein [Paracoccaceae bacterium]
MLGKTLRTARQAGARTGLALGLAAAAATAAPAQEPVTITFFIWAGSNQGIVPMEVIEAYRAANPHVTIEILESNNAITYPRMVAARMTTPDDPLVHCGFFNVDSMNKGDVDDMWESMNPERVTNMANVIPEFIREDARGVGYQMSGIGILYNKDAVATPPDSWTVLWAEGNDKKVTFFDYDTRMLAIAARLNGGDEYNIDPGFQTWANAAANIRALVDSNDGVKNLLVSGDAHYAPWFSSLANVWINEGAPLGFAVPKEGLIAFPIYLTIAKGVTDAERAVCEDLVNTLLEPDNAGRYGALTFAIPVVRNASQSPEQMANPMLNIELAETAILLDYKHIAEESAGWRERWDREVKFRMR